MVLICRIIYILQLMTKQLSPAFFGDKKLTQKLHQQLLQYGEYSHEDIHIIFQPYTSRLTNIKNNNSGITLLDLFNQFIQAVIQQFADWEFQKFTSVVEIAAHIFEHSFEHWLTREQSFKYFSDVAVRHSLFRPPHSVCVFTYEELTEFTTFWISHFHRYYEYYYECMASSLNQMLTCRCLPWQPRGQCSLKQGRQVEKTQIQEQLH